MRTIALSKRINIKQLLTALLLKLYAPAVVVIGYNSLKVSESINKTIFQTQNSENRLEYLFPRYQKLLKLMS
jgi:hypothetical protein